ncbi:unnamed protein product [Spirodela intermedia]|uniref:Uncharacterized protein n=1 Tax=Spirodela intermedia TaxID=51605 RepID=A0A7I8J1D1_SPIIN|nr:unnamed protein product [Spirodela intermedia]CAA6663120.1 unnamed protein product [Spirodela intermedia]
MGLIFSKHLTSTLNFLMVISLVGSYVVA